MKDRREFSLILLLIGLVTILALSKPVAQDPNFHNFADQSPFGAIPHFWNVISNLLFIIVGLGGMLKLRSLRLNIGKHPSEWFFFIGVFLTGFGSSFYHWAPSNYRLFWDRAPMTVAFTGFLSFLIVHAISDKWGKRLSLPFLIFGILSVVYWDFTEQRGAGDLRLYGLVQFGILIYIPVILGLYRERLKSKVWVYAALLLYGAAKFFEFSDLEIYQMLGKQIGGHPLKHLAAGGATALLSRWIFIIRAR